jgi:DNA-binding IclR family transcriptional regulator
MPDQIPPDVEAFVREWIGSIAELELLLLVAEDTSRAWDVDDVARQLYVTPAAADTVLHQMTARGLVVQEGASFRFAPKKTELNGTVGRLRDEYAKRRLRIVELIYAGPAEKFQSFADAFRLRKGH